MAPMLHMERADECCLPLDGEMPAAINPCCVEQQEKGPTPPPLHDKRTIPGHRSNISRKHLILCIFPVFNLNLWLIVNCKRARSNDSLLALKRKGTEPGTACRAPTNSNRIELPLLFDSSA